MSLNNKLLIFDGAMGTMLQEKGFAHKMIPEELNIEMFRLKDLMVVLKTLIGVELILQEVVLSL